MQELTLAVVGIDFANVDGSNRRFEIALCQPGDPIELRPEPKNPHDSRAIAVWRADGGQMGYVTAERCGWVGQRMAAEGAEAIYLGQVGNAAYIRVRFAGGAPTLPVPTSSADAPADAAYTDDDFQPDPEGPDWGA